MGAQTFSLKNGIIFCELLIPIPPLANMPLRLEITQRLARLRLHAVQHTQLDLQCLRHDGPDVHGDMVAHAERPVVLGQPREVRR